VTHGILLVFSDPIDETRTRDYNDWYNHTHLPEVLSLSGFTAARRFHLSDHQLRSQGGYDRVAQRIPSSHVALYEVEAENIAAAVASLNDYGASLSATSHMDYSAILAVALEETFRLDPTAH
jgi:hypothetical protein